MESYGMPESLNDLPGNLNITLCILTHFFHFTGPGEGYGSLAPPSMTHSEAHVSEQWDQGAYDSLFQGVESQQLSAMMPSQDFDAHLRRPSHTFFIPTPHRASIISDSLCLERRLLPEQRQSGSGPEPLAETIDFAFVFFLLGAVRLPRNQA